jgi:hypothetical protein
MPKSAIITLTTAGTDTGPFNLLSDIDSYATPFETNIAKSSLIAGYTTNLVPDAATIVRVQSSSSLCTNFINLTYPTSTTTTTTSTTTTTTTAPPTTTTTTTSTTTTTTTAPTYYYYVIKEYDCANSCAYVSPDLVGRSSTPLSTTSGVYYKLLLDPNVYQVQNTAETTVWDINLDGASSDIVCSVACTL